MPPSQPLANQYYTVGWICALPLEMTAARAMLDEYHGTSQETRPSDRNSYCLGRIKEHNVVITCLPAGVYGTTSAAVVAAQMLSSFEHIKIGLMVGIGGGVPSKERDIRLGDVVVSKPGKTFGGVIQYDYGKTMEKGRFVQTGSLNKPPPILLTAMAKLESQHKMEDSKVSELLSEMIQKHPKLQPDFIHQGAENDRLYQATYDHVDDNDEDRACTSCDVSQEVWRPVRSRQVPAIHYGIVASGNQVMKYGVKRDQLGKELDVLCFEMEAAGLMDNFPCLVIRGICDYSDSHKNKRWQAYAAATAAAYAKELLYNIPRNQLAETHSAAETTSQSPFHCKTIDDIKQSSP
jgi:nucleoside phosphorylase